MFKIAISIVFSILMAHVLPVMAQEDGVQQPNYEVIASTLKNDVKHSVKKFSSNKTKTVKEKKEVTWRENPNGCEPTRIRADNLECLPPLEDVEPATPQPSETPSTVAVTGNKEDWLRAAGIPESVWTYVDFIVTKESGWNPNAVNPSSGACGLGQQLPCGKWAGAWNDPVAALIAMNEYVHGERFDAYGGGWVGAYNFWLANHWY